jgi:hypothetical protein
MRTTVTLDHDVRRLLEEEMQRSGLSFKEALNAALRRGLSPPTTDDELFQVHAKPMRLRPGLDPVAIHELDTELEIERFRRITQRLVDDERSS